MSDHIKVLLPRHPAARIIVAALILFLIVGPNWLPVLTSLSNSVEESDVGKGDENVASLLGVVPASQKASSTYVPSRLTNVLVNLAVMLPLFVVYSRILRARFRRYEPAIVENNRVYGVVGCSALLILLVLPTSTTVDYFQDHPPVSAYPLVEIGGGALIGWIMYAFMYSVVVPGIFGGSDRANSDDSEFPK